MIIVAIKTSLNSRARECPDEGISAKSFRVQ